MLNRETMNFITTTAEYRKAQEGFFVIKRTYNEPFYGVCNDEFISRFSTMEEAFDWKNEHTPESAESLYMVFQCSECGIMEISHRRSDVRNIRDYATGLWDRYGEDVKSLYDNSFEVFLTYIKVECYLSKTQKFKNSTFVDEYRLCDCCHKYHTRDSFTNNSGFCNECAANYSKCSVCGRYHHNDQLLSYKEIKVPMTASEKSHFIKGACHACVDSLTAEYKQCGYYHEAPQDAPLFYNASRKNSPLTTDENSKTRYFGIEFELATDEDELYAIYGDETIDFDMDDALRDATKDTLRHLSDNGFSRHIYAESDGSIEPLGYEFITNAMTLDFIAQSRIVNVFLTGAEKHGFYQHNSCGMHIHINRASLNKYSVAKMNVMLSVLENHDYNGYITRISGRESCNEWANIINFSDVHYCDSTEEKYACIYETMRRSDRYVALNSKNKNTIEFRFFGATMDEKVVMERLYFVNALCSFANNNTLEACENITPQKLVKWDSRVGDLFDRYGVEC